MRIRFSWFVIALALLTIGTSVPAVEKSPKKTPATQPSKTPAPAVKDTPKSKAKEQPAPPKKFDDFIDKNKNGVDDRKENLKKADSK